MHEFYTPKQIAKMLNVSTTTLRRYEEQNLIPEVSRTAINRRCYTSLHVQAFATIRALLRGFEIPVVYEVMRKIKNGDIEDALWVINLQQYNLQAEKERVTGIMTMLRNADFPKFGKVKGTDWMNIGEVAQIAGVNPSAIRHWEKEGLITPGRNRENGYRVYAMAELRKIIVISSLRNTVYFIESMKQLLNDLETHHYSKVERSFQLALQKLNSQLTLQFQGISELMKYVKVSFPSHSE